MPGIPAVLGTARLGAFRLGYLSPELRAGRRHVRIYLAGVEVSGRVSIGSLTIHDSLNDNPNTCSLVFDGTEVPQPGQRLRVEHGSDPPVLLFNGALQSVDLGYVGYAEDVPVPAYPVTAIDDLADLNRRRPFGSWVVVSATTIAQEIIAAFAPGFSDAGIELGLPLVSVDFDGTEGFSGCLAQLAKAVGGVFKVEDLVVYLFTEEAGPARRDRRYAGAVPR